MVRHLSFALNCFVCCFVCCFVDLLLAIFSGQSGHPLIFLAGMQISYGLELSYLYKR